MPQRPRQSAAPSGPSLPGLGPDSRLVYAALIEEGGDLAQVRAKAGPGTDVDAAIDVLTRLRLVHRAAGDDTYTPVSPGEAAEEVAGPREAAAYEALEEAASLRRLLRELAPLYRSAASGSQVSASSEILRDSHEVNARIQELIPGVRKSVASAQPTMAAPEILEASLSMDRALLARGIAYRSLFTHTARRYHLSVAHLRALQDLGGQVRTAALIPSRMILLDDEYAILPVSSGEAVAAVVRDPPVVAYLHEFFDYLWERGQRLTDEAAGEDRVPQELEIAILHELAEGRTDEAISRRLGISSRTLRRYLSAMLDSFGVETRFQLGMAAVRQGLISGEESDPM
ncbi:MAG: helix-turn-helix domain-containing protein [Tetrasphaera sp.]|jgi:DNA-binding CsgD family transcriptional regulator|nr:helix-turn-helix domain-containing protein [Tetrasphaera sp.]